MTVVTHTDAPVKSGLALGANLLPGGECVFRVWAPRAQRVELKLQRKLNPPVKGGYLKGGHSASFGGSGQAAVGHPAEQAEVIPMLREEDGYFALRIACAAG